MPNPMPAALPGEVIAEVAKAYRLSPADITGKSKLASLVRARNMAAFILRERGKSNGQVGRTLGGRDHSTIIHACRRFEACASESEMAFARQLIGGAE